MHESLENMRKQYDKDSLDKKSVAKDPVIQFEKWMSEAMYAKLPEPNAMTLATADINGKPTARIVLLKGIENGVFIFYTNFESKKGQDLLYNPYAALVFFWHPLEKQIRIEGRVEKISAENSEKYFHSRPRASQLSAAVSPQSTPIPNRDFLEEKIKSLEKKVGQSEIPLPENWGGYRIIPNRFEFWQGRADRLHDRIVYVQIENKEWKIERLAP
jgi:pyridoxamine 5'-phosphate oxidase